MNTENFPTIKPNSDLYPEEKEAKAASLTRVCDLDESDKPREKALRNGIATLSDAELLAIIIGSGMPGKSVLDLSREILRTNDGRLSRVQRMSVHELCKKYDGIGPAKAIALVAAFELGKRYQADLRNSDTRITGSDSIYNYIRNDIENLPYEVFLVIHLNRANRIIYVDTVSKGGTASTVVDVKVVMKNAVDKLSAGLIFVHNHPSGTLMPSTEDDMLTRRLKDAAKLLDIVVLDHIIISSAGYYSYADSGRL